MDGDINRAWATGCFIVVAAMILLVMLLPSYCDTMKRERQAQGATPIPYCQKEKATK